MDAVGRAVGVGLGPGGVAGGDAPGEVLVTLHVYSRGREKPLDAAEVVVASRSVLERRTITVPPGSETPTGYVRFGNSRSRIIRDGMRRGGEGWRARGSAVRGGSERGVNR